ncbi:hydroxyethylthiazole kinase [Rhodococcus sp. Leaf7]|uniref:hydroxyethylthiazole kinase n=1 Tax=unclassified Rhodococcus (in: high G+C Gram-positive bacteria) TaxID=192944 RepID=UPI0006F3E1C7|nr:MULTISPECIES: hydroxyethylthiazole kinase [unclassified Rhodococcus (in: high G+C Gram-positive bacteria)]KQU03968.1 hydroxyethylthiazole kinase [Rhodococcus sp. Leaf7]KQU40152.1 hydroxyethylthiazole kinase [Rhodococcus sp. Leaf247]
MTDSARLVADALTSMRDRAPLVHAVTNYVTAGFTANVLLAAGASAAMVDNEDEAALFAGVADAVLINLGTPQPQLREVYLATASAASAAGTPWVLDPIAAGGLPWRGALARDLLTHRPAAVRGNASEIIGLDGLSAEGSDSRGRGVDSSDDPADAVESARRLLSHATAVSASGEIDHVITADGVATITGGSALMTKVTGTGCSLGALVAAYCAAVDDYGLATIAAHTHATVAADIAAETATAPGSFAVAYLDALHAVTPDDILRRAHVEWRPR